MAGHLLADVVEGNLEQMRFKHLVYSPLYGRLLLFPIQKSILLRMDKLMMFLRMSNL